MFSLYQQVQNILLSRAVGLHDALTLNKLYLRCNILIPRTKNLLCVMLSSKTRFVACKYIFRYVPKRRSLTFNLRHLFRAINTAIKILRHYLILTAAFYVNLYLHLH